MIDLGTGPGVLALGFAPYVGSILGVDPEPAMVAEARRAAAEAEIAFPVIEGRAEDLAADCGPFDLITIGRSLHWMDRPATLAAFDRAGRARADLRIQYGSRSQSVAPRLRRADAKLGRRP